MPNGSNLRDQTLGNESTVPLL